MQPLHFTCKKTFNINTAKKIEISKTWLIPKTWLYHIQAFALTKWTWATLVINLCVTPTPHPPFLPFFYISTSCCVSAVLHPLHTSNPLSLHSNAPVWRPGATLTPEMRNGQQHHGTVGKQYGTGWELEIGRQYFDSVKKKRGENQSVKEEQFVAWKGAKVVNKPLTLYLLWGCYFTEWQLYLPQHTCSFLSDNLFHTPP